jgi:hypothetical protein
MAIPNPATASFRATVLSLVTHSKKNIGGYHLFAPAQLPGSGADAFVKGEVIPRRRVSSDFEIDWAREKPSNWK